MGHTITEKILASHSGRREVTPGEIVDAEIDLLMMNELGAALTIEAFEDFGLGKVYDPDKVVIITDHFVPCKDVRAAEVVKISRGFCEKHGIRNFFTLGRMGIEHAILPEKGLVYPGQLFLGGDSHTPTSGAVGCFAAGMGSTDCAAVLATGRLWLKVPPTIRIICHGKPKKWVSGKDLILHIIGRIGVEGARYASVEFAGEAIANMSMDERFTITNMTAEAGAKAALMEPDETTLAYLEKRVKCPFTVVKSDPDAVYDQILEIDASALEPQVAFPFLPSNVRNVGEAGDVTIDQVVIGSCTNGRISDLRTAASILKGRKIHPEVRLIVIPASQEIYLQALREGLIEIFTEAEGVVSTPTCGPCLGGHMGILAAGERALATTNRNFRGRMGHLDSEVYLCNPAVAAASALCGRICTPEEVS
jgi:3-isopropylmalate/(R)-2-methylmalate dehydratase large subunit